MKSPCWLMLLVVASCQAAHAADPGDLSPYDANPSCMSRTTDSSTGNCVIQTEGSPRHRYPPPGPAAAVRNLGGSTGSSGMTSPAPTATGNARTAASAASRSGSK
jgi:hypothetical protein